MDGERYEEFFLDPQEPQHRCLSVLAVVSSAALRSEIRRGVGESGDRTRSTNEVGRCSDPYQKSGRKMRGKKMIFLPHIFLPSFISF